MSRMYKQLDTLGFQSGQEFSIGFQEAQKLGAVVLLGDRPVQVTLQRLAAAVQQTGSSKLFNNKLDSVQMQAAGLDGTNMKMDAAGISQMMEKLKNRASVTMLMGILKEEVPLVYEAMVQERDQYMSEKLAKYLAKSGKQSAVAIVGIAHMDGIEHFLQTDYGYKLRPISAGKW